MAESEVSKPGLLCPCGAGICPLLTSTTQKNPGRLFYRCPAPRQDQCGFFKWHDQLQTHDRFIDVPLCACGAGICRIQTEPTGTNAGRNFFVCPIKKGQGACNYFRWQDAEANVETSCTGDESFSCSPSMLTICSDTNRSNNNLVEEEGEPTDLGNEIQSFINATLQFSEDLAPYSSPLKRNKILEELKRGSKEKSDKPFSRKQHSKRVTPHTDSKSGVIPFGSSEDCCWELLPNLEFSLTQEPSQDSFQALNMKVDEKTNEFRRQSSVHETACSSPSKYSPSSTLLMNLEVLLGSCLIVTMFRQDIYLQFQDWLGRLAFCPPKSLMEPAPKPLFCCVFPSFDPILVSKKVTVYDDHVPASSPGSPFGAVTNTRPLSTVNRCPTPLHPKKSSIMTESVSKAFGKAAELLQNDLLTLLKSMDIKDHETMSEEADSTFAALDQLQIDHRNFSGQVKEFIGYASLLAKIDQSISNDHSCELLLDRINSERMKLHEINDAYFASKRHLMLLSKEVSRLKDKLSQIEAELCCYQAENLALKARIVQIGEAKGEVWEGFQIALMELRNAYRLRELREAEQSAAMAAFEKAKMVLWG